MTRFCEITPFSHCDLEDHNGWFLNAFRVLKTAPQSLKWDLRLHKNPTLWCAAACTFLPASALAVCLAADALQTRFRTWRASDSEALSEASNTPERLGPLSTYSSGWEASVLVSASGPSPLYKIWINQNNIQGKKLILKFWEELVDGRHGILWMVTLYAGLNVLKPSHKCLW